MQGTILHCLEKNAQLQPRQPVFTILETNKLEGISYTFEEVRNKALQCAGWLMGVSQRAAIILPQGIDFTTTFLGCLYAKVTAIPLAMPTRPEGWEAIAALLKQTQTTHLICNQKTWQKIIAWCQALQITPPHGLLLENMTGADTANTAAWVHMPGANDLAFIQCTSGSVSAPKAVMVTHANIMANSAIISHTFDTTPNSVSVCWLPSYHDMGLIDGILQPIYAGFHSIHLSPMHFLSKPAHWLLAMSKYKATYSGGPNFAFDYCAQRMADAELELLDFSNLQCIYNGAEPISLQTLQRFLQRFSKAGFQPQQLLTCYGLAEGTLAVTTAALGHAPMACHRPTMETRPFDQWPLHMPIDDMVVSSGSPRLDTKVWIVDEEGQPCSEGQTGEIVIGGTSITAGYWQAAETTQQAYFFYNGHPCFRTGDLGFIWQQQLYINGRLKDLIILRGKNHYPQDIENVAANAYPDLENNGCAAFSIQQNGEEQLVIVQEIKRTALATFAADSATKKIQLALSQHFGIVATAIIFVSPRTIPKTTSGKVQRNKCKSLILSKQIIPFQNDKNQRGDHYMAATKNC